MKLRCPNCGASLSLDALLAQEETREAVLAAFRLGGVLGQALLRYIGLFRPAQRELSFGRVAKLINELLPEVERGEIERDGKRYPAPVEAWCWAIQSMLDKRERMRLPLTSHGYLKEVISSWSGAQLPAERPGQLPVSAGSVGAQATVNLLARAQEARQRD